MAGRDTGPNQLIRGWEGRESDQYKLASLTEKNSRTYHDHHPQPIFVLFPAPEGGSKKGSLLLSWTSYSSGYPFSLRLKCTKKSLFWKHKGKPESQQALSFAILNKGAKLLEHGRMKSNDFSKSSRTDYYS
ncbi:hypothetical protein QYF36_018934 [Acer negundo]|nr:hypothetical protein QYF36_018934 [Acer negundo]